MINLQEGEKFGVTVSGGKDSLYAWYKLVEYFGPEKVVAFNHKNRSCPLQWLFTTLIVPMKY